MSDKRIDQLMPIIHQLENRGNTDCSKTVSPAGAIGCYQIMPATARSLGYDPRLLTNPVYNETVARSALADLIRQHGDDTEAVIAGYNASPKVVNAWMRAGRNPGALPPETQGYLERARPLIAKINGGTAGIDYAMHGPSGKVENQKMQDAGFTPMEVAHDKATVSRSMLDNGFSPKEVDQYYGDAPPDLTSMKNLIAHDVSRAAGSEQQSTSLWGDIMAGWQHSAIGLTIGRPNVGPRDAGLWSDVATGAAQMTGDLPLMALGIPVGAAGGAAVGTAVAPGPGTAIGSVAGGGAGAFAVPEAYREIMMDHYNNPNGHKTWREFWGAAAGITWNTTKAATVGAVSSFIGGKAGVKVLEKTGSRMLSSTASLSSMATTATGVGSALDGHIPSARDFATSLITVLGFHAAGRGVGAMDRYVFSPAANQLDTNMKDIYKRTGIPPWEQAKRANADPILKSDLMSKDVNNEPIVERFNQIKPDEVTPYAPKVTAEKPNVTVSTDQSKLSPGQKSALEANPELRVFHMTFGTGEEGMITGEVQGSNFWVSNIASGGGRNSNGPGVMREVLSQLKDQLPPEIKTISGLRITGARAKSGTVKGSPDTVFRIRDEDVMIQATDQKRVFTPEIMQKYGVDAEKLKDDPEYANKKGLEIISDLMKHFQDDREAAFIAFNSSIGQAEAWQARGRSDAQLPAETQRALDRAQRGGAFDEPPKLPPPGEPGAGAAPKDNRQRKITDKTIQPTAETILDQGMDIVNEPIQKSMYRRGKDLFSSAYDETVSELGPAKRMDDAIKLKEGQFGIEDGFRATYASQEVAGHFLTSGAVDAITRARTSKESLKGVYDLAKKNGGTKEGFVGYRLAVRFLEKAKQGIDTGWRSDKGTVEERMADAIKVMKEMEPKYMDALAMATRVNNGKLDYMRDSGLYSEKYINEIKQNNKAWIPMGRVAEGEVKVAGKGFGKFMPGKRLKKMEGSEKQILEPVIAEIESFSRGIASADRNRAIGQVVGSQELQKVFGLKRIEGGSIYQGGEITNGIFKGGTKVEYDADPDDFALAEKKAYGSLGANEFPFWRDGKMEVWSSSDPLVTKMIRGMGQVEAGVMLKPLAWFAGIQRSGITTLPDYIAKMVIRDQFSTPVVEKYGGVPFQNLIFGTWAALRMPEYGWHFIRNGGAGGALASLDANYVERNVEKLFTDTTVFDRIINKVANPIEAARLMMERADTISRMGTMMRQEKRGVGSFKAGMMARTQLLDFKEKGTSAFLNMWASWTPFLRPTVLGMDQDARALKDNFFGTATRGMMYIGIPAAALFALNWLQDKDKHPDDPTRYDQVPAWQRDTMFVFPEMDGVRPRMPMASGPMGVVIGGLVNRGLEYAATQDPRAFHGWATDFLSQFTPNLTPALALPMLEHGFDVSLFTGKKLVPTSLEGHHGFMQYTENTTEPAKNLSKFISPLVDISPIYLENYLKGWFGSVGADLLRASNTITNAGKNKPWQVADIPFVSSFVIRNPTMQATTIQNFFDTYNEISLNNADFSLALKRANMQEISAAGAKDSAFVSLAGFAQNIHDIYAVVININDDPDQKPYEKAQQIETLYSTMITISRAGILLADSIDDKKNHP